MIKVICRHGVVFLALLLFGQPALAQFEEGKQTIILNPLAGAAIFAGASDIVTYAKVPGEVSKKIKNIVSLKINEQSTIYCKSAFTAVVYLKIESWAVSDPLSTAIQTQYSSLSVNYDTAAGAKYEVRAYILLDAAEQVKITVDTLSITGNTGWDPRPLLQLENEMRVLRYYDLSSVPALLTPSFTAAADKTDALQVSWAWNYATNNNMSQLEWAWLSAEIPAGYYAGNNQVFQNNSTRVDLDAGQNTYTIPLLYGDTGRLYYRLRAALLKNDGSVLTGPWSLPQAFPASGFFNGHQNNLNWQSSTSFAENSKFKTVIQYLDGTLRPRQSVTKDNSTGNTVVAETLYDLQGRPNLQILPTPTTSGIIQYYRDFNRFDVPGQLNSPSNTDNPARYFDLSLDALKCKAAPRLDTAFGNGRYYSSANPWLATEQKSAYIPNAQGYAFTETRYTDDATQRVSRQGGVGETFQINNGHDTRYFYGKPSQPELDALFGTEAGDASHYSKNMVQDANGQMSVSYVDMHGRTVATALAGDSTDNLQAVYTNAAWYPSNKNVSVTNRLLTPANNIITGNSIESISTIVVPATSLDTFTYSLDPEILNLLDCNNQPVCFDCKYDLEISLRPEDCSSTPLVKKYNNLQITPCGSSMGFTGEGITLPVKQISFVQSLSAGSWIVRKTLTINDSVFLARKDSALAAFLCVSEQAIYDSLYNTVEAGCASPAFNTTLPCDSCKANLGSFPVYKANYLLAISKTLPNEDIHLQYTLDSLACAGACGALSVNLSSLQSLRNRLLHDMVPYSGQYAIEKDSVQNVLGQVDPARAEAKYNIFTTDHFRHPLNEAGLAADYFSEEEHIDFTIEPTGLPKDRSLLDTITAAAYVNLFQPSWAKSLLYYHPEFSKLKFAETTLLSSYAWLDAVEACETYAAALAKGYVTPLSSDPYFVNNYVPADKMVMQQYLYSNLGASGETSKFSLWQIANGNVACALISDLKKGDCMAAAKKDGPDVSLDPDALWEQFKVMYLSYRNERVVSFINSQSGVLSQSGMDALQQENKQLVFAGAKDIADQNGWTWWPLATAASVDTAALLLAASTYVNQIASTDKCAGQKPFWKARLLQCEQLQSWLAKNTAADSSVVNHILAVILDSMVLVCRNSATVQAPYGYPAVNPAYPGTPESFESIINNVFAQNGISSLAGSNYFCNPYSIDFPKPFGKNPPLWVNNTNSIDSCACRRFAALKLQAAAAGFDTANFPGLNSFLLANYKDSLPLLVGQGLQKCRAGLFKDTCYNVITGPGYPYDPGNQLHASLKVPCEDCPPPPTCPPPTIDYAYYRNTTNSLNNITVNYSTGSSYTACSLSIFDGQGRYIKNLALPCGADESITVSLPQCQAYKFTINAEGPGCDLASPVTTLAAACADCPAPAVISAVAYLNTGSINNVQLNYTSSPASASCRVVVTDLRTGVKYAQSLIGGSSSVALTRPGCQSYSFRIFTGVEGDCYDSSNLFLLPACTLRCKTIYTPVLLPAYVAMPAFLSCDYQKPCTSCSTLQALVAEFKTIYPDYAVPYTDSLSFTDQQLKQNSLLARFLNYRTGFAKNANEYLLAINGCSGGGTAYALCSFAKPLTDISGILEADTLPCRAAQTQAAFRAQLIYRQRKDALLAAFDSLYLAKCLGAKYLEQFYVVYQPKEYHYTLYYYDQAGNLVKTMPPAAVTPNYDPRYLAQVAIARNASSDLNNANNNEGLATHYRYNSLNQVIAQKTPDAGSSDFWYDRLGRLVISRNAKQATSSLSAYSYTLYDALGRITEVGQKPQGVPMRQAISQDTTLLKNWLNGGGAKEQITVTKYDEAYTPIAVSTLTGSGLWQKNLRNRVSYTCVKAFEGTDPAYPWEAATFYTYDIHGNVDTLLQDYKTGLGAVNCAGSPSGNRFKKMVYSYDLISGKVNDVAYQPGQADGFYHHYNYDAENRLTEVKTSRDKIYWEREAVYDYYRHGPLARTLLGENQVQGLDYAYTLQGWLKGVNSTAVLPAAGGTSYDMGQDGIALQANSLVARDAYGFSLNYFVGDYSAINASVTPFAALPASLPGDINGIATGKQLFNGNIAAMAVNIPVLGKGIFYGYSYDQLNRIVRMDAFEGLANAGNSFTPVRLDNYHEAISYDPNGNIQTYLRQGDSRSTGMDELSYHYTPNTNQLNHVTDAVVTPTPADYNDIKTQSVNNYSYDQIGDLVSDVTEGISDIKWTLYGKIRSITKSNGTLIKYSYDAAGNRLSKIVTTSTTGDSTYYVRDASGNVMSVYNKKGALNLFQTELHLYGTSRLGVYNVNVDVQNCSATNGLVTTFTRGNKFFELSNHLGNTLAVISDRKLQVSLDGIFVGYYMPEVVMGNDYAPFGSLLAGRKYSQGGSRYRFGFNGKENDNEVKGEGGQQDYGMRIYDTRLGRFLSVDPLTKSYPHYTPYSYAGNKPIWFIDLDGGEEKQHWYQYDFSDLMNWFGRSDNSLSSVGNGQGPIGTQLDNFNKNINPIGIIGHGVYSTVTGKDLTTGGNVDRGTAFTNMSANLIMTAAGEKLATGFFTSQAEREMASVTLKPKMQQTALRTSKADEQATGALIKKEVSTETQSITLKNAVPQTGEAFVSHNVSLSGGKVNITGRTVTNGTFDFVVTNEGKLIIGNGHYNLSGGANSVEAAGQLSIYKGKVTNINNSSGHYLPTLDEARNYESILKNAGVDVSGAKLNLYNNVGNKVETIKL